MNIVAGTVPPRGYVLEHRYFYHHSNGTIAFAKFRYRPAETCEGQRSKEFRYRHISNGVLVGSKPPGADALLYRLPGLLRAKRKGENIWWPEGEKDADAINRAGAFATTHHQGAGHSTPEQAEAFRGHTGPVILAFDLDQDDPQTGGNPGAACVVKRYEHLRAVGIELSQIVVCHALSGKDVADHLSAGHALDEMVPISQSQLLNLMAQAARTRPATLRRYLGIRDAR